MTQNSVNIAPWERWVSGLAGSALLGRALRRQPSVLNSALAVGGVLLIGRSLTGECSLYRALGLSTRRPTRPAASPPSRAAADAVDIASDQSFPASDPPAWAASSVGSPA